MKKNWLAFLLAIIMVLTGTGFSAPAALGAREELDAYDQLRLKWYDMAVGGDYDTADPALQPMIQSINDTAQDYWERMNPHPVCNAVNGRYQGASDAGDPAQDYLWEEYPLGWRGGSIDSNSIHFTYQYLRAMALAHETRGCALYQNAELLADIERGLDYLYTNHFNESVSSYSNWFGWGIGGPIYLNETLILLYDSLPWEIIQTYASVSRKWAENNMGGAANSLWQLRASMYAGILLKDNKGNYKGSQMTGGDMLKRVQSKVPDYLGYVTSGDGYYKDGTYIAHGNITYNGGYGYTALSESCHLLYMLHGTTWEIQNEKSKNVFQWIYDSYETIIYNGLLMDAFRGREVARTDMKQADAAIIIANAMLMAVEMAEPEDAANFKAMIKQWYAGNDYTLNNLNESADLPWHKFPMDTVVRILKIVDDPSVQPCDLTGKYIQFTQGDRAVQRGGQYSAAVTMASKRIAHSESTSWDVNVKGWNLGSGTTYLYNGDLERYDGNNKPTIDWNRLPGTTSVYNKKVGQGTSSAAFAGGTGDGVYGLSGMQLAAPGTNLKAKKSWFLFDNEIVALGADIRSSDDSAATETTFENYMIQDSGENTLVVDGQERVKALGDQETLLDVSYLNIEGNVPGSNLGIYFPEKETVQAKREARSGRWTDLGGYNTDTSLCTANYLTLWKDHGVNPENGQYAYVLLPNQTADETASYAQDSDTDVLRNDTQVQAVYEKNLNLLGANFWEGAALDHNGMTAYLSADAAASVMVRENDRELTLSVSDPTQENKGSINLELNRAARGVISADAGVEVVSTSPTIKLKVNVNNAKGKTSTVKLSFAALDVPEQTAIQSLRSEGDEVVVELAPASRATGYTLKYGTEPGVYSYEQSTSGTSVRLNGLTAGQTYYFTATAFNASGEGPAAAEKSFSVPLTTQLSDPYDTLDKILDRSANILLEVSDGANFGGDTTTLKRDTMSDGWLTYSLPSLTDFTLVSYIHSTGPGTVTLFVSPDNAAWTMVETNDQTSGSGWVRHTLTPKNGVPAGTNYLKIVLSGDKKAWSPQLSSLTATIANGVKERQLVDSMGDFSKLYCADNAVLQNGTVTAAEGASASLVYSMTNMQEIAVQSSGRVKLSVSNDGEAYTDVALKDTDGTYRAALDGASYCRLTLDGDTAVSGVRIDYLHEIAPVEAIRFEEDTFRAVSQYSAVPAVKKAPMNGVGELIYASSDEETAVYVDGVLYGKTVGKAELTVSVLGSDVSASASVEVYHNAALNRSATGSAYYLNYTPDKAFDGSLNDSARWQSSGSGTAWIQVDLGEVVEFDWTDLFWDTVGDYQMQFSEDGETWSEPIVRTAADGKSIAIETPGTRARYAKLTGLTTNGVYGLIEWRLNGRSAGGGSEPVVANIALNRQTLCSNENTSGGYPAKNAVDGDLDTRWDVDKSHRDDTQWIAVDLGERSTVTAVNLNFEAAYAKEYKLQISNDGKNWTDLLVNNAGAPGWNTHVLEQPVETRYVKMQCVKRGTTYGVSLFEFEVMGYNSTSSEPMEVTALAMDQKAVKLLRGRTAQLDVTTEPAQVNAASIAWESSDPSIATVDANGVVTARNEGTAVIIAHAVLNPALKAECTITVAPYSGVPVPVESVEITGVPEDALKTGEQWNLTAVVLPENASNRNVQWTSSDTTVARVNSRGVVTAVGEGKTIITARSVVSDFEDRVELHVAPKEAPSAHVLTVQYGANATMELAGDVEKEILVRDGLYAASVVGGTELTMQFAPKGEDVTFRSATLNGEPVDGVQPHGLTTAYTMKNSNTNLTFVFEVVRKTTLKTILDTAEELAGGEEFENAVPSVQKKFTAALKAAQDVYADDTAAQEAVDGAWRDLLKAVHYLSFARGDKTQLERLADLAQTLEETDFTAESFTRMTKALETANAVLADEDALVKDVQDAYDALYSALNRLDRTADSTELESLLAKAAEIENSLNLYMTDGKQSFVEALANARETMEDNTASQKEIDTAATSLASAMAALRKLAEKTQLEELLREAEAKDLSLYTASSAAQFLAARNVLAALAGRAEVSEQEADAAVKAYLVAEGNLKPADQKTGSSSGGSAGKPKNHAVGTQVLPASPLAAATRSVISDTTAPFTVKRGGAYCFKITVAGTSAVPDFTVGNGSVFKTQFVAKIGNAYYYRVWAIGTPGQSTGVYTRMPNEEPQKHCVVTIA